MTASASPAVSAGPIAEPTRLDRDELAFLAAALGDSALESLDGFGLLRIGSDQAAGRARLVRRGVMTAQAAAGGPVHPLLAQLAELRQAPVRWEVVRADLSGRFRWVYGLGPRGGVVAGPVPRSEPAREPEAYVVGRLAAGGLAEHVRWAAGLRQISAEQPPGPDRQALEVPAALLARLVADVRAGSHDAVRRTLCGLGWGPGWAARFVHVYADLRGAGFVHRRDASAAPVITGSTLEWNHGGGQAWIVEHAETTSYLTPCSLGEVRGELERILGQPPAERPHG